MNIKMKEESYYGKHCEEEQHLKVIGDLMKDNNVFEAKVKELKKQLAEAMQTIYRCTCQPNGGG